MPVVRLTAVVSEEDVRTGRAKSPYDCPACLAVVRAVRDRYPDAVVRVSISDRLVVYPDAGPVLFTRQDTPAALLRWFSDFDAGHRPPAGLVIPFFVYTEARPCPKT